MTGISVHFTPKMLSKSINNSNKGFKMKNTAYQHFGNIKLILTLTELRKFLFNLSSTTRSGPLKCSDTAR